MSHEEVLINVFYQTVWLALRVPTLEPGLTRIRLSIVLWRCLTAPLRVLYYMSSKREIRGAVRRSR